jgi:hypothetical protein
MWLRIAPIVVSALSIFLGYRLFCDVSGRRSGVFTSLASGALLALFGMGILIADFRGIAKPASDLKPAWQKKSSGAPRVDPDATVDRFV